MRAREAAGAALAIACLLVPLWCAGCAPPALERREISSSSPPASAQPPATSVAVEPMPFDERRSTLPASFPLEVPVPAGAVHRAEAQGDSAWGYQIEVAAPVSDVAQWYRSAYTGASWVLDEGDVSDSGGTMEFSKGSGAQSKVWLEATDDGTLATVSLGIGEPVNETL